MDRLHATHEQTVSTHVGSHSAQLEAVERLHHAQLQAVEGTHAAQLATVESAHAEDQQRRQSDYSTQMQAVESTAKAQLATLESTHAEDRQRRQSDYDQLGEILKGEYQQALDSHAVQVDELEEAQRVRESELHQGHESAVEQLQRQYAEEAKRHAAAVARAQAEKEEALQAVERAKVARERLGMSSPRLPPRPGQAVEEAPGLAKRLFTRFGWLVYLVGACLIIQLAGRHEWVQQHVVVPYVLPTVIPLVKRSKFVRRHTIDALTTSELAERLDTASEQLRSLFHDGLEPPGTQLLARGAAKRHPVVFVPGVTSTALELWQGDPCAGPQGSLFRKVVYSGAAMVGLAVRDLRCWFDHMSLNATTWRDPEGIRLRASSGLGSSDYFLASAVEGFFIWGNLVKELGTLGYDESSLYMASYDWRLSMAELERRDRYFTVLKTRVELLKATNEDEKVVVMCHSMGSNVWNYFMQWVTQNDPSWVDTHVDSVALVGNSLLGSPKVLAALLTGDVRDVLESWFPLEYLMNKVVSKADFVGLFRSWGSFPMLLPVGGERIWGNATWAPDASSAPRSLVPLGNLLQFEKVGHPNVAKVRVQAPSETPEDLDADGNDAGAAKAEVEAAVDAEAGAEVEAEAGVEVEASAEVEVTDGAMVAPSLDLASAEFESSEEPERPEQAEVQAEAAAYLDLDDKVTDPPTPSRTGVVDALEAIEKANITDERIGQVLGSALTVDEAHALLRETAPTYGALVDAHYDYDFADGFEDPTAQWASAGHDDPRKWANPLAVPLPVAPNLAIYCLHGIGVPTDRSYHLTSNEKYGSSGHQTLPFKINATAADAPSGLESGVQLVDGDGTLTTLALGFPCAKLWASSRFNPGGTSIVLREYEHAPGDGSKGPGSAAGSSADHLHILGNRAVVTDLLRIATGFFEEGAGGGGGGGAVAGEGEGKEAGAPVGAAAAGAGVEAGAEEVGQRPGQGKLSKTVKAEAARLKKEWDARDKAEKKEAATRAKKQRKQEQQWAKDGANVAFIKGGTSRGSERQLAPRVLSNVREVAAGIPMHEDGPVWW